MQTTDKKTMKCRVCSDGSIRVIDRVETPNCDVAVPVCRCRTCGHFSLFPTQYQQQKAFEWDGVDYYLADLDQRRKAASHVLDRMCTVFRKSNGRAAETFLDAGCAIGLSLSLAKARGMQAVGVEPEARLAEYGRIQLGVDVRHAKLEDLDPDRQLFDLVYCEQVLEHVENPTRFLLQLKSLLAPGGLLYLGVPPVFLLNRLSTFMIRKMHLPLPMNVLTNIFHDPDEHISVFTRQSMCRLAENAGMHLEKLPLTLATFTLRRLIRQLLTFGSSPGTYLLSRGNRI